MPPIKKKKKHIEKLKENISRGYAFVAAFLVLGIFVFHPLAVTPASYENITETKLNSFIIIVVITLIFLLMSVMSAALTVPDYFKLQNGFKGAVKSLRPYEYAIAAYWLIMLVSTIFSEHPAEAFLGSSARNEGLLIMTLFFAAALLLGRLYSPKERDLLILCAVASLICIYGIFQYYGVDFLNLMDGDFVEGPSTLFFATMSNRNVVSSYILLTFCVAVVMFVKNKTPLSLLYLPMAWVMSYMLVIGQTEGGYVGILAAVAIIFPFLFSNKKEAGRFFLAVAGCVFWLWVNMLVYKPGWAPSPWMAFKPFLLPLTLILAGTCVLLMFIPRLPLLSRRVFAIIWYAVIIALIIAFVIAIPQIAKVSSHKTIHAVNEILSGNIDDSLGSNRIYIWRRALTLVREKPIIGHGPDNFFPAFAKAFGEEAMELYNVYFDKAHNEYLQVLVDNGILGLLALLSFYGLIIRQAFKNLNRPEVLAITFALTAFLVQAFFNIFTPFADPVAWVLWGMLAAYCYGKDKADVSAGR